MKKLKFLSIIVIYVALLLPLALVKNVSAGPAEDCEDAGGTPRLAQNSSTGEYEFSFCECPNDGIFRGGACIETTELKSELCEEAGGTPSLVQNGSTGEYEFSGCSCPNGGTYYRLECLSRSDLRIKLCQESGGTARQTQNSSTGEYSYSGCECPAGYNVIGSECVSAESSTASVEGADPERDIGGRQSLASNDPAANCETDSGEALNSDNCRIIGLIVDAINILSGLAGLAIVASLVIAGYQYMTARDNAGQIQKAKTRIIWALSALALFIFMYALLNFLVPGGVL